MHKQTLLNFPAEHPAFAGHFPGTPIVPGVLLLDAVLRTIANDTGLDVTAWQVSSVKFLSPLKPNESVVIEYEIQTNGSVKFQVLRTDKLVDRQVVSGQLITNKVAEKPVDA